MLFQAFIFPQRRKKKRKEGSFCLSGFSLCSIFGGRSDCSLAG